MRKLMFVGLVAVMLLAMASIALAGGYATWTPGGANGTSPHTGYSDSSTKCKVCHAVHNASSAVGAETLLRSSRQNACIFCHLNPGTVSTLRPYGQGAGNEARYTAENAYNHDNDHNGNYATYYGCVSCHTVHGANSLGTAQGMGFDGEHILKSDPGLNGGGAVATVNSVNDFCRDCHDGSGQNVAGGGCFTGVCHTAGGAGGIDISPTYFTEARNGVTHVMTTTLTGNYSTTVAWDSSENCSKCHAAGTGAFTEGNDFPHYTPNAVQFLPDYTTENTGMDAACLNCHVEGGNGTAYTTGVGKTF